MFEAYLTDFLRIPLKKNNQTAITSSEIFLSIFIADSSILAHLAKSEGVTFEQGFEINQPHFQLQNSAVALIPAFINQNCNIAIKPAILDELWSQQDQKFFDF